MSNRDIKAAFLGLLGCNGAAVMWLLSNGDVWLTVLCAVVFVPSFLVLGNWAMYAIYQGVVNTVEYVRRGQQ